MNFPMTQFKNYSCILSWTLCLIVALTLQTQITILQSDTYLGLRINLTDLLVPFAGIAVLVSLFKHESVMPRWNMDGIYIWMGVITVLFSFGILNSYLNYEELSQWGLTNKLGGWLILASIFCMGGWIGTNAKQAHIELFLKTLLYYALIIFVYQIAVMVSKTYLPDAGWIPFNSSIQFPIEGLMANRNAYALFIIGVVAIATCFYLSGHNIVHPFYTYALYFLLPYFAVFNGSRTSFGILCVMIVSLLLTYCRSSGKRCLCLLLSVALGTCAFIATYHGKWEQINYIKASMYEVVVEAKKNVGSQNYILTDIGQNITNPGDSMRLTILQDSLDMVEQHPVIGSGLGSVFFFQEKKHGKLINLIDCTPLWLLVETGAIGLIIFTLFYFRIIKSICACLKTDEGFTKTLRTSLLFIILGFSIMCLLHEIMYTRHMWFLIGLGLTLPSRMRQDV